METENNLDCTCGTDSGCVMHDRAQTQHTPGPWKIVKKGVFNIRFVGADGFGIADTTEVDEREKANARLIAAAPDMLEALKYIVAWKPKDWNPETARDMAQQAIAKAEGRKP